MRNVDILLRSLRERGAQIWSEQGRLRYRVPKGSLLPGEIEELRGQKTKVIAHLESERSAIEPPLVPRLPSDVVPLTFQQQWLWNNIQKDGSWHFSIGVAVRLLGILNIETLQASLETVCRRHEALRTRIINVNGVPRQCIDEHYDHKLEVINVTSDSEEGLEAKARRLAGEFVWKQIDLDVGPLFKARLLRLGDSVHVLVLAIDHMVSDGTSLSLLISEVYSLVQGAPSPLSKITIQYGDYAVWQQRTNEIWKERHGPYWQLRLEGARRIRLPVDEVLTATPFSGASIQIQIEKELRSGLRELARRERTTLARVMLTLYVCLVSRVCNTQDILVPFNTMGRHMPILNNTVGYFPHILYLRIELKQNDTFLDVLKHVDDELNAGCEHDDFGQMISSMPEFLEGTWFQWDPWVLADIGVGREKQSATSNTTGSDVLRMENFPLPVKRNDNGKVTIDIGMCFMDGGERIVGIIGYRADLFKACTIERFARNLLSFAQNLVNDARVRIATVPIEGSAI